MEAIILIGIQGAGKSSFFRERFFNSHVRISLDMLRTRHRERLLLEACLNAKQPFAVDNTNITIEARARYILPARAAGFKIVGYYFKADLKAALRRNSLRGGREHIPEKGLVGTYKRLQIPSTAEGFDALYYVELVESNQFEVKSWSDEV